MYSGRRFSAPTANKTPSYYLLVTKLLAQVSGLKVPSKWTYLPDALKLLFGAISYSSILFFANQFCLSIIKKEDRLPTPLFANLKQPTKEIDNWVII